MRVFLGLGDAQLRHAGIGNDLAEGVAQVLRREQCRHEAVQVGRIFDKTQRGGESDAFLAFEAGEIGVEQRRGDLADPVGAEIGEEHTIAITHAAVIGDRRRQHEFVRLAARIGGLDRLHRIVGMLAGGGGQRGVGFGDPVPTLVAVHRVIAAGGRSYPDIAVTGNILLELLKIPGSGLGRRIAAI